MLIDILSRIGFQRGSPTQKLMLTGGLWPGKVWEPPGEPNHAQPSELRLCAAIKATAAAKRHPNKVNRRSDLKASDEKTLAVYFGVFVNYASKTLPKITTGLRGRVCTRL